LCPKACVAAIAAVANDLSTAFTLSLETGRAEAIGAIGLQFGRFLDATGDKDQARIVLGHAARAATTLGHAALLAAIETALAGLGPAGGGTGAA
jgi:hypothetical protein